MPRPELELKTSTQISIHRKTSTQFLYFFGGNGAYTFQMPSTVPSIDFAQTLAVLSTSLSQLGGAILIFSFPHRNTYRKQASIVNTEIQKIAESTFEVSRTIM